MDRRWLVAIAGAASIAPLYLGVAAMTFARAPGVSWRIFPPAGTATVAPAPVAARAAPGPMGPTAPAGPTVATLMEQIQGEYTTLLKLLKTEKTYWKSRTEVADAAGRMSKLAASLRGRTEPAEQVNTPQWAWENDVNTFTSAIQGLILIAEQDQDDVNWNEVRQARSTLQQSCTGCHNTFKPAE